MDPVSVIVSAIVGGASAALKDVSSAAVKDAYSQFKQLIFARYRTLTPIVESVETEPASQTEQDALAAHLRKLGADQDSELLRGAQLVLETTERYLSDQGTAAVILK